MARYTFRCRSHGEQDDYFPMEVVPSKIACRFCEKNADRVYGDFYYQEDRTRFYKNPVNGTKVSSVTGQVVPDSRRELMRQYDRLGIEPVTKRTMPEQWKTCVEYDRHVKSGGDRVDPKEIVPPTDTSDVKSVRQRIREKRAEERRRASAIAPNIGGSNAKS